MTMYDCGYHHTTSKNKLLKISHGFMADTIIASFKIDFLLVLKPVDVLRPITVILSEDND